MYDVLGLNSCDVGFWMPNPKRDSKLPKGLLISHTGPLCPAPLQTAGKQLLECPIASLFAGHISLPFPPWMNADGI